MTPSLHLDSTRATFAAAAAYPHVGIDLEFLQDETPTLVCAAGGEPGGTVYASSLDWNEGKDLVRELVEGNGKLVGHAVTTVDAPVTARALGIDPIPYQRLEDTYIWHYLLNADFCKTKEKGDGTESRGGGQLDLWTMASIYTDLNQWKACKGTPCDGPCPTHDPVGYNAMDGVAPLLALPNLWAEATRKGVTRAAYDHVAALSVLCDSMERRGIKLDVPYLRELDDKMRRRKEGLFTYETKHKIGKKGQELKATYKEWNSPFQPTSPKDVVEYFSSHGVALKSAQKADLDRAVRAYRKRADHDPDVLSWLTRLAEYKGEGKGLDAWFSDKYIDALGYCHPRFIACGTSTGRLASAKPNFQNIPKHGDWAREIRRAIVARDPGLELLRADSKQLELRMVLFLAGVEDDYGDDAFGWLVRSAPKLFEAASHTVSSAQYKGTGLHESGVPKGHRQLAKRISHAGNYMEGFRVFYDRDLRSARTAKAASEGALALYPDWEYAGGIVGFTGANLARELFDGKAGWVERRKALEIQEAYFKRFPQIRAWHRKVTAAADEGEIRSITGRYLALRGTAEERAKEAASFWGQGGGADYVQRGMLALDAAGYPPLLNIHDENVVEVTREMSDGDAYELMQLMAGEFADMEGFSCPVDVERGSNYIDTRGLRWH